MVPWTLSAARQRLKLSPFSDRHYFKQPPQSFALEESREVSKKVDEGGG
jgi:hypothetical protein